MPIMACHYGTLETGVPNTLEYRIFVTRNGTSISPFHDIPLYYDAEDTILNMVVEIPRWTNNKLEITKDEILNPIKQDTLENKPRYVRNCFPYKGYIWNYGALPRTWEDPNFIHPDTEAKGDNDPLDVCEIGERVGYPGEIKQVKVLGILALLDGEDTDWKIIAIDIKDPLAPELNDIEDIELHMPGLLQATREWFRIYKVPDGKPANKFSFNGECKNKAYAKRVIEKCADAWRHLISTHEHQIAVVNTTMEGSPGYVTHISQDLVPDLSVQQQSSPSSIDKWYFINEV
ncbi:Inorganic pyrophosphatase [Trichoderma cf. simile WF8]